MKLKISKYFFFSLIFLLSGLFGYTQSADTLVVYEYVYKTDTVWVEVERVRDTIILDQLNSIENTTLLIDTATMNANLVIFSSGKSATIPINRILINEAYQQKITSMKKITFLGLALLAFSAVKAQPEKIKYGIYDKVNLEQQIVQYDELGQMRPDENNIYNEGVAVTESKGFFLSLPIGSNVTFTPTLNYSKKRGLIKKSQTCFSDGYCFDRYNGTTPPKFHFIGTDLLLNYNFSQLKMRWLNVHTGIQFEGLVYKDYNNISLDYSPYQELIISYNVGVGFDFLKRCNLKFEYSKNLNKFVNNNEISIKYQNISVGLGFYLF